jgi:hypothetical protein
MTTPEAKRLLRIHSGRDADSDPAKWEMGFVCQLRPYRGSLNENNFREVMEAIRALAPEMAASTFVDRELMADLWSLIWLPRMWAFPPHGVLRGKGLIDGQTLSVLDDWLNRISEAVSYALEGSPECVSDAMIEYGQPLPDFLTGRG